MAAKRPSLQERVTTHLPEDVFPDILVRLPLQSIIRFKSICKNWYSLIQSRFFIEYHRNHHLHKNHKDELFFSRNHVKPIADTTVDEPYIVSTLSESSILKRNQSTRPFTLEILQRTLAAFRVNPLLMKVPYNFQSINVLGPLKNGISCVMAHEYVRNDESGKRVVHTKLALCNLGTKQFNFIDYPFITDLRMMYHHYGFCSFESLNGVTIDYKVVVIEQNFRRKQLRASVYSHRRGGWEMVYELSSSSSSTLTEVIIIQDLKTFPAQALLHGFCHWMAAGRNAKLSNHVIVQFDMDKEVFGVIEAPPEDEYIGTGKYMRSMVFVLDGCIAALVSAMKGFMSERIDVWKMMEYGVGSSWRKVFSHKINVYDISRFLGMTFHDKTNDIERIFFERKRKYLMSCDGSEVKEHGGFHNYWACCKPFGLSAFVETLEPSDLLS